MLRKVRRSIFETNSSSTHSISMANKNDYDKWKNDEVLFNGSEFVSQEEAIKCIKEDKYFIKHNSDFDFSDEDAVNELLKDNDYYTYDNYGNDYEYFSQSHKTQSGDEIVAFGYYGYDG
jgi:hypothetical protein